VWIVALVGALAAMRDARVRAPAAVALVCAAAPWLLPTTFSGWDFAGMRPAPLGLLVALCLAPVERLSARARVVLGAMSVVVAVAAGGAGARLHARLDAQLAPAVALLEGPDSVEVREEPAGAARVTTGGPLQPLLLAKLPPADVPHHNALLHVGQLYALRFGGLAPWGQVEIPAIHHVLLRPDVPRGIEPGYMPAWKVGPDLDDAPTHVFKRTQLASWARASGRAFLYGRPGDLADLVARGWRVEARVDDARTAGGADVALLRFAGCRARLAFDVVDVPRTLTLAPAAPVRDVAPEVSAVVPPGTAGADEVAGLSCGPAHLRVTPRCAEDPPEGPRTVTLVDGTTLPCTAPAPAAGAPAPALPP
jgi:hypothetical protein